MWKILLTTTLLILGITKLYSADYFWVGGDGNWSNINHWATSSGGSIKHIQTPTFNDNVFFDINSSSTNFSIDLNIGTIYSNNFNASQLNNKLTLTGVCNLWKVYGDLLLSDSLTITNSPDIYFEVQGGNSNIESHEKLMGIDLFFKGTAIYTLQDKLICGRIVLESGTLITNSQEVNAISFKSNSNIARNIELGTSLLNINNWQVTGNGFTVDAGSSTININSYTFLHNSNGSYSYHNLIFHSVGYMDNQGLPMQFHKLKFNKDGTINGDNTIDSLIFKKGRQYVLEVNKTQTINDELIANGDCKQPISILAIGSFATIYKSSGIIDCNYLILNHIHADGNASFTANGSVDNGDNLGWNITAPLSRNLYWVGDIGDWNDTIHWAASSGGIGGECIPTTVDNVFIDDSSFSVLNEVRLNYPDGNCHDFHWANNVVGTLSFSNNINISGSLTFGDSTTLSSGGEIHFISNQNGETITTSNIELNTSSLFFEGRTGGWTLQDSVNNSEGLIIHTKGHLNTNSQYIHVLNLNIIGFESRELSLGSSIIDVNNRLIVRQDTLVVNPNTSHFRFLKGAPIIHTVGANPDEFYNLTIDGDSSNAISDIEGTIFNKIERFQDMILDGHCFSDTLILKKGKTYVYKYGQEIVNNALIANGDCHNVITLREFSGIGTFDILMPPTSTINADNVAIRGCNAYGGASFIANNSSDLGSNSGWVFTPNSQDHYWVNGGGNWQDSAHWSLSNGGISGACIPKIDDDVFFNANSGFTSGDSVAVDTNNIFCRDMDWSNISGNPVFFDTSEYVHYISGSLKLDTNMLFECTAETFFVGEQQNKTIESASKIFKGNIILADSGRWTLVDSLQVLTKITHYKGDFITAQNPVYTATYLGIGDYYKTLNIQNNKLYILPDYDSRLFSWHISNSTNILAGNSVINFLEGGTISAQGSSGQLIVNDVHFLDEANNGIIQHSSNVSISFNNLHIHGDGEIEGDNYIDSLFLYPSGEYQLEGGQDQYINSYIQANGSCYGDIGISSKGGGVANVNCPNPISINYVRLKNITAIGNGPWIDNNGTDMGGNSSNWQIIPIPSRNLYWVGDGGEWWDTAHWALSSGGASGECIPTYRDDVNFDSSSFYTTFDTINSSSGYINCHTMEWNYIASEPFVSIGDLNIYGSLLLADTLDISIVSNIYMKAVDTGNVIRSRNQKLPKLYFISDGAWTLEDDINAMYIEHNKGYLNSNSKLLSTNSYKSWTTNLRTLKIDNSTLHIEKSIKINTDSFSLISSNSDIHFIDSTSIPSFDFTTKGNNELSFNNISFDKIMAGNTEVHNYSSSHHSINKMTINNNASIFGEYIFDSLIFYAGNTYTLEKNKTQEIIDYWFIRGNNCYALNLQSSKKGTQAFVHKNGGIVTADFMNVRDINVGGSSMYFAGLFSTDIDNNTGWNFTNGPQYIYGLGADTSFTLGGSITLNSNNFNGGPTTTYLWSTGSTADQINVNQTGWYYITVSYAGDCVVMDSIFVGCDLVMNYDATHNICFGDSLGSIEALVPDTNYYYTYLWFNNDSTDFINGLAAGKYTVEVGADSGLCIVNDTIEILEAAQIFTSQTDTAFCIGDSIMLDLGNFQDFEWDDNHSGQYRWVSRADTFYVKVKDADGCWSLLDSIGIRRDTLPHIKLSNDTTICMGESVDLDAGSGFEEYLWSNNSAFSTITISNTGQYWVRIKENTCYNSDTIMVYNCPAIFDVPNVFTPNGDGYNDFFNIESQNIWSFEIRVYSRWGLLVHKSYSLDLPWDGKILNEDAVEGVYFWQISYEEYNGEGGGYKAKEIKGTVTLMR